MEQAIAAIWRELLGLESIGRHDNFFALGGHSLLVVTLTERMRQQGFHADLRTLFANPTLAALAAASGGLSIIVPPNRIGPDSVEITPEMLPLVELTQQQIDSIVAMTTGGSANIQDIYPLAPLQEGIFFHHLLQREGDAYLLPNLIAFDSRSRLDVFVDALQRVIDRHDILRTAVLCEGLAAPVQVVWRHAPLLIEEVCLDGAGDNAAELLQSRFDPRCWRMDVRQAPLMRGFAAYDPASSRWLLQLLSHHLALDHTTLEIVLDEIRCHLCAETASLPAALPFRNFVAQALLGVSVEEHEAYFRTMLGDVDEPCAPFGLLDVQGDGSDVEEVRIDLSDRLSALLRSQARALGVSVASLFHLAWAQVVARTTGHERVVFGTVLFGRMQGGAGADRTLGMFINTLPLRIEIDDVSVVESVRIVQKRLAGLLRHEHAPLSLVQRCSGVPAPAPLFTSLLNYRYSVQTEGSTETMAWDGIERLSGHESTNYPLGVSVDDVGSGFSVKVQTQRPLVPARICTFLVNALEGLADALAHAPETAVRDLDVLPEAERHQVLMEWNATTKDYPRDACVHELFEAQVARTPSAIAVVQGEVALTYGELNARANRLAHSLRELGVCPDGAGDNAAELLQSRFDPRCWRMDVRQAPLMRGFAAYDPASSRWLLQLLSHHLALDHTTLEIVLDEIRCHLCAETASLPAALPFRNFVAQALLGVSVEEHEAYFRTMLGDVDEPCAPFGLLDVQGDGSDVEEVRIDLSDRLSALLRSQARALGVSVASLFHLAWAQVVARTTGHERVVFGTVLFGRMQGGAGADRTLGMFINTLPLRIEIDDVSVVESVRIVQKRLAGLLRHEHAPLSLVQRCSGVPAPAPLFTSLLNYRYSVQTEGSTETMAWDGIERLSGHESTNYPLGVSVDDVGSGFSVKVQTQRPLVPARICTFLVNALEGLADALAHAPETAVRDLDVLPEAERHQVLMEWNATTKDYPRDACVHELFEAQVARTPSAIAVVQGEVALTYGELNARANRLAHSLRELGVCPDDRVAICMQRSVEMVVAVLAVLKAGGAYVPLDPA
ncbi:condensation domain-containing protein, partial [Xanthomonas sp. MUS 060]|uniref:condensation domain-containing protein n=1 Tax=Xanthomonas sp. MUS 060 TaxID=1588031 RepID=UPI001F2494A8